MDVGLDNLADKEGDHGRLAGPRLGLGDDAVDGDDWDDGALLDGYALDDGWIWRGGDGALLDGYALDDGRIWRGGDGACRGHARRGAGGDCRAAVS